MKRAGISLGLVFLGLTLFAQQTSYETPAANIGVAVRVLDGDRFVNNLTIDDFAVYEDGKRQRIEALYFIKKSQIQRKEEKTAFSPSQQRHFYLFFEISEYSSQIEEAVDNFILNVLSQGDNLILVSPLKTYRMKSETLQTLSKEELSHQIGQILKKDVLSATAEYKNIIRDIKSVAKALYAHQYGNVPGEMKDQTTGGIIELGRAGLMTRYMSLLKIFEELRKVDEEKLIQFSQLLQYQKGQKEIFLFYQRESMPIVEPRLLQTLSGFSADRPDVTYNLTYMSDFMDRDLAFDTDQLKRALWSASTTIHFLFFTQPQNVESGVERRKRMGKWFDSIKEMAEETGGQVVSSDNPALLFEKSTDILENYYLLYYIPKDNKSDQELRRIEIKVKEAEYTISHQKGYLNK